MKSLEGRWLLLAVLTAALAALIASAVWVSHSNPDLHAPPGMLVDTVDNGPVHDLADAQRAAERFADRWGLNVGEVMQFSNGYYAQLLSRDGSPATEVLVDPRTGRVQLEFGPAMMWNTGYSMMGGHWSNRDAAIGEGAAVRIADSWLAAHRPGLLANAPDRFPGYYTLHTVRDGRIVGMLSVNAFTGDVWYHTWHGRFIGMDEHP